MLIYIPTYGRPHRQITFSKFTPELRKLVWFVVRGEEHDGVRERWGAECAGVVVQQGAGVAAARQTAVEHAATRRRDKLLFFDDDLQFSRRVPDWDKKTNARALAAKPADVAEGVRWLWDKLDDYPCVGLCGRGGNHGRKQRWHDENYRIMRSFGIRRSAMRTAGVRFDDFYYWEDFHVALSLLELGMPNLVNMDILSDGVTNTKGGVQRDVAKMWPAARRFAKLHPHATLKTKTFRWGEAILEAPDFTIAWKKAYGSKL